MTHYSTLLLIIATTTAANAATLFGINPAFVDCSQAKYWEESGQFIELTSVACVDPSEGATYTKYNVFDSFTGEFDSLYVSSGLTDSSTPIKSIADAEAYFSGWLADHLVNYTAPIIYTWAELDIADVPNYNTWNYINDEENGPIDVSLDWWIDWGEFGVPRYGNSQPSDFGKWMWDGSINPNYVEPIVLKSKGRKHRK